MFSCRYAFFSMGLALFANWGGMLQAQTAPVPTAYTVTEINSFGEPQLMTIYRQGSKVLIDLVSAAQAGDPKATHTRNLNDLDTHRSLSWSWPDSTGSCGSGTFSGDWGDPFAGVDSLIGKDVKQVGTEKVHGFSAKVLEAATPSGTVRVWVDTKTSLLLKAQLTAPGAATKTFIEVTEASLTPPPASVFSVPASCAGTAAAPPPTESEQIAALTGGNAQDFVRAIYGPATKNSCTAVIRVVKAGTMEPITSGFQIAVDLDYEKEPTPHYSIGVSDQAGHTTWSGGGVKDVTSRMRNGVIRIENIPEQFTLFTAFPGYSSGDGLTYRQCFAPQTVLLFVVKNPAKLSDGGEWLWVRSGKFAAVP